MTQNDEAWKKIFERLPLLQEIEKTGFVYVSADDIKAASDKREPRLLAKQDTKNSRPDLFKHYKLSILPVENGKYIIFRDEENKTYYPIEKILAEIAVEEYQPTKDYREYQSLDVSSLSSESQAIDFANLVSLLKTFTNEKGMDLTIRGRQRSEKFPVKIPRINDCINVEGVQIEVDAGFESSEKIYILEAKLGRIEDFNIRQLYYPFKDWSCRSSKEIIPLFFIYTNGLFYILQFKFGEEYGNLQCVKSKCYTVNEPAKQALNLKQLLKESQIESEPADIPYPQANNLDTVIDIISNYYTANLSNKPAIAEFFDFDERQGDYYANAGYYLGLLERIPDSTEFALTEEGVIISKSKNRSQRNLLLLKQMLKKPSLNEIFGLFEANNFNLSSLNIGIVAPIIKKHVDIGDTTARRRASTVISWVRWVDKVMEFKE